MLAGGEFSMAMKADTSTERPAISGKITGRDFPAAFFLPEKFASQLEGMLSVDANLAATGKTPAQLAANLDGQVQLLMGEGRANLRGLEGVVGGIGTALGTLLNPGDEWSVVNCIALRFPVKKGLATADLMLFDSRFATVGGEGTINLDNETLDLTVTPRAKAAVTLSVSAPVHVGGTLLHPTFKPDTAGVARRLAGIAGIFVFPPAAIAGLGELGANKNQCVSIAQTEARNERPAANAPAATPTVPAVPAIQEGVGRALENLNQGLQNLFGR